MVSRKAESRLKKLAKQFPSVLILGARQCGKTTLARRCVQGRYFDLEKPSDVQIFSDDIEFALRRLQYPVILDLIVERGARRIGYEFKCAGSASGRDWTHLKTGMAEGVIHKGILVHLGDKTFPVSDTISVIPAGDLLLRKELP